ncbi:hypothetical protein AMAG_08572 [Allomyces macrogynus ATCC 38327]|uniref:RRM domain-containing protein n=1 Tax=Allomyces macrogynus (strain ATCC 38327) TaxID=578462 RepID=A0A0L0SLM1_ALLM3|nr:hypothetical protein AMAG_08572 [Allomyces macrogynus ATCC 38327]|eukprot:KNE63446.1 hypothetical protein AMAG_08572 [Allomyces macrogynus ATCC 38327]
MAAPKRERAPSGNDQQQQQHAGAKRPRTDDAATKNSPVVFVGQLPFSATQAELQTLFEKFGTVVAVRMSKKSIRKFSKVKHLFTGCAHVEYATPAEATTACRKLAGYQYEGRTLRSDMAATHTPSVRAPTAEPSDTLFVANLPYGFSDSDLEAMFRPQRGFGRVRVPDANKGFAYVQFDDEDAAQAAVRALNGANFKGRRIRIDYANSQQRATFKSNKVESKKEEAKEVSSSDEDEDEDEDESSDEEGGEKEGSDDAESSDDGSDEDDDDSQSDDSDAALAPAPTKKGQQRNPVAKPTKPASSDDDSEEDNDEESDEDGKSDADSDASSDSDDSESD